MPIGGTRKSDSGNDTKKMKGIKPTDLLIPGASILILLILTIFVYIPSLRDASKLRVEIKAVKGKQEVLLKNLEIVNKLKENQVQLQKDLKKTKQIIPQKLDVADFSYYVDKLARDNGLTFREISAQNTSKSTQEENKITKNQSVENYVSGVSGPITYEGTYEEIVEFLDQLQKKSPYIIEARQLELNKLGIRDDEDQEDIWQIELNLMGYYIEATSKVTLAQLYLPITPYTLYPQYLEIFEYKSQILNEEIVQETPEE